MKRIITLFCLVGLMGCPAQAQWSGSAASPVQVSESYTWGEQMEVDAAGNIYVYYLMPEAGLRITPYVKKINYDGTEAWGEPVRLSAYPTKTYTMVNNYMTLDQEDNVVAVVWDARLDSTGGNYTATAYKISPEGKMLWGEDGVNLTGGNGFAFGACMNLTTLDDNSTVFAWAGMRERVSSASGGFQWYTAGIYGPGLSSDERPSETEAACGLAQAQAESQSQAEAQSQAQAKASGEQAIYMQRVTADGKAQWTDKKITVAQANVTYPYMVNAGRNEYFMFYCQGATPEFYVQKFDFDGNAVWAQPTLVYGMGGFGNGGAMQTIVSVAPAKNGMLIGWNDDRDNTRFESVYLAYIDRDGKHVFGSSSEGLKIGYSGQRCFKPEMVYNTEEDEIYATWVETNGGQSYRQVRAQRISASGELMWGEEGIELCPMAERQAGQQSVQVGPKGTAIFFYMTQKGLGDYNHTSAFAALYGQDGKPVWEQEEVALTDGAYAQGGLKSLPLRKNQWVVGFNDNRNYNGSLNNDDFFIQNILIDGTLGDDAHLDEGDDGGDEVANEGGLEAAAFGVYPNPVQDRFNVRLATGAPAALRLTLCAVTGQEMAVLYEGRVEAGMLHLARPAGLKAGLYMLKAVVDGRESSVKVLLR